jgi:hypothetical protein
VRDDRSTEKMSKPRTRLSAAGIALVFLAAWIAGFGASSLLSGRITAANLGWATFGAVLMTAILWFRNGRV